ncbi:MAG: hypothetical protein COT15_04010 [Candidatus Diapherotrites archaeon CG08_land_8_20_14_0_20_34_12]|nr:MAG: hypothetical protein COT15_04010 [Candidatus Diapherotrites archaeon CG08_land_8_20_14_0_20_34_12]
MNITMSVSGDLEKGIRKYPHIKWTEVARKAMTEELGKVRKLEILQKFIDKEKFSDEDEEWMNRNNWHPIEQLALNPKFIKEAQRIEKKGRYL